jgi:NAD-dependent dihydropyrimidine dehydrogenase PreA subunit
MTVHMQTHTGKHACAEAKRCVGICPVYVSELSLENSPVILVAVTAKNKQTPWPLVHKRTIPTDRPPLVDEI